MCAAISMLEAHRRRTVRFFLTQQTCDAGHGLSLLLTAEVDGEKVSMHVPHMPAVLTLCIGSAARSSSAASVGLHDHSEQSTTPSCGAHQLQRWHARNTRVWTPVVVCQSATLSQGCSDRVQHKLLFDAGPTEELWERNADRWRLPLADVEACVLSHWCAAQHAAAWQ